VLQRSKYTVPIDNLWHLSIFESDWYHTLYLCSHNWVLSTKWQIITLAMNRVPQYLLTASTEATGSQSWCCDRKSWPSRGKSLFWAGKRQQYSHHPSQQAHATSSYRALVISYLWNYCCNFSLL
jgi:hypothetical protein